MDDNAFEFDKNDKICGDCGSNNVRLDVETWLPYCDNCIRKRAISFDFRCDRLQDALRVIRDGSLLPDYVFFHTTASNALPYGCNCGNCKNALKGEVKE